MARLLLWVATASIVLGSGCGPRLQTARPVDSPMAIETLRIALETWKSGGTAADLRHHRPEIVAQDRDWMQGTELKDYELLGEHEVADANLHCNVRLILAGPNGQSVEKSVVYIVGTDPVLTVFRKVF
jgi:hypothetical protein